MAKSRSFFGLRRGSTKSFTFSVLGGQQITKERVLEVKNPRSYAQQFQRAKFASMVKFFKQLPSGLLTYAYEDKKANESFYNAFMRHNANRICTYLASQNASDSILASGDVIISDGTLGEVKLQRGANDETGYVFTSNLLNAPNTLATVADLSNVLIANGYKDGDIVNCVVQVSDIVIVEKAPYFSDATEAHARINIIFSCYVDPLDNTSLLSHVKSTSEGVEEVFRFIGVSGNLSVNLMIGDDVKNINVALIISRRTSSGVKVSTSNMTCPSDFPLEKMRFDAYAPIPSRPGVAPQTNWTELVAQSYDGKEGDAILQGGLVTEGVEVLQIASSPSTPATWDELSGKSITFNKPLDTPRSFYQDYGMQLYFDQSTGNKCLFNGPTWENALVLDEAVGKICDVTISEDHKTVTFGSIEAGGTNQVVSINLTPVVD